MKVYKYKLRHACLVPIVHHNVSLAPAVFRSRWERTKWRCVQAISCFATLKQRLALRFPNQGTAADAQAINNEGVHAAADIDFALRIAKDAARRMPRSAPPLALSPCPAQEPLFRGLRWNTPLIGFLCRNWRGSSSLTETPLNTTLGAPHRCVNALMTQLLRRETPFMFRRSSMKHNITPSIQNRVVAQVLSNRLLQRYQSCGSHSTLFSALSI